MRRNVKGAIVFSTISFFLDIANPRIQRKTQDKSFFRIGYVGSFLPYQGVDILIDAMRLVLDKRKDVVLYVVGGGLGLADAHRRASDLGRYVVFTGHLSHEKVLEMLDTFDLIVIPRRRQSATELLIPMKLVEALSRGIPMVVTRHRSLEQCFVDKVHLLYAEPDPAKVAERLLEALANPELLAKISKNALEAAKNFDPEVNAKAVFSAVMGHSG